MNSPAIPSLNRNDAVEAGSAPASGAVSGGGRILFSQLDLQRCVDRVSPGYDPVAERILLHLLDAVGMLVMSGEDNLGVQGQDQLTPPCPRKPALVKTAGVRGPRRRTDKRDDAAGRHSAPRG